MRKRIILSLILITAALGPASAQDSRRGGVRTETMDRIAGQQSANDLIWNLVGLIGLLGLFGLKSSHSDDSYHPSSVE